MSSRTVQLTAQVLTIVTFVMLCWVAERSLEARVSCVNSSFISFVQISGERFVNCKFESRLSPRDLISPVSKQNQDFLRALEILEPMAPLFPAYLNQGLAVDVVAREPDLFELGRGYVRIGSNWLKNTTQLRRALVMGVLRTEFPQTYTNQFQLETIADFILLALFSSDEWQGSDQKIYSLVRDLKFSTAAPTFAQYCASPFRSLSHKSVCETEMDNALAKVWGFRPLLAVSMFRVYEKLALVDKIAVIKGLVSGKPLPVVHDVREGGAEELVEWFKVTLNEHLAAVFPKSEAIQFSIKRTLKELEVESPTKWELTLDLTATPAWREIVEQMRTRAQFKKERVLIFTPEGAKALPSGLPVAWAASDISSQKHVMIACDWPKPEDTVHVKARHLFAQQSCAKLQRAFWD